MDPNSDNYLRMPCQTEFQIKHPFSSQKKGREMSSIIELTLPPWADPPMAENPSHKKRRTYMKLFWICDINRK
jgi:hypothetical protein